MTVSGTPFSGPAEADFFKKGRTCTYVIKLMRPPHFPVPYSALTAAVEYKNGCPDTFKIGSVTVTPIALSHPNGGCGYKFREDNKSFVFLTDNELGFLHPGGCRPADYVSFCRDADLLIHDAEFTPEEYLMTMEWGHSSWKNTLQLAIDAEVKQLGLFHLNQDRTDDQMDEIVNGCRRILADKRIEIQCVGVSQDMVFEL